MIASHQLKDSGCTCSIYRHELHICIGNCKLLYKFLLFLHSIKWLTNLFCPIAGSLVASSRLVV